MYLLTKISFVGVESGGQAVYISGGIYTTPFANDSGHSNKHWRLLACLGQK
jgi:hypothetical protein